MTVLFQLLRFTAQMTKIDTSFKMALWLHTACEQRLAHLYAQMTSNPTTDIQYVLQLNHVISAQYFFLSFFLLRDSTISCDDTWAPRAIDCLVLA